MINNFLKHKILEFIDNLKIKKTQKHYSKLYIKNKNQVNKTFIFSKKYKISIHCISSNSKKYLKFFILYHLKIGVDIINLITPHKKIFFSISETDWIKKNNKEVNLINFDFKNFDQKTLINHSIAKEKKNTIILVLDGDEFLFTNKKINLDTFNLNLCNLRCSQINFLGQINKNNKIEDIVCRKKKYQSEKKLLFHKDYEINDLVSLKTIIFLNDREVNVSKGNHYIFNKKKHKYLNNFYILHLKLINKSDVRLRMQFEKNRKFNRENNYESITSSLFIDSLDENKINYIWEKNSYKNQNSKNIILDYSILSCIKLVKEI